MSYWSRHPFQGFMARIWFAAIVAFAVHPIPYAPLIVMGVWALQEAKMNHP